MGAPAKKTTITQSEKDAVRAKEAAINAKDKQVQSQKKKK